MAILQNVRENESTRKCVGPGGCSVQLTIIDASFDRKVVAKSRAILVSPNPQDRDCAPALPSQDDSSATVVTATESVIVKPLQGAKVSRDTRKTGKKPVIRQDSGLSASSDLSTTNDFAVEFNSPTCLLPSIGSSRIRHPWHQERCIRHWNAGTSAWLQTEATSGNQFLPGSRCYPSFSACHKTA